MKEVDILTFDPGEVSADPEGVYSLAFIEELQKRLNQGYEIKGVGCDDRACAIILQYEK
jgi:hypothetical protein